MNETWVQANPSPRNKSAAMLMTEEKQKMLASMVTAPYMALATMAICRPRKISGNQFRHMAATRDILIDYGYIDGILHKAALVHDLLEDINEFDHQLIINCDHDGPEVYKLVVEVTKQPYESKIDFLKRIYDQGSDKACLIKSADRIANLCDVMFLMENEFITRLCEESEKYILPIAARVSGDMCTEISDLIAKARWLLSVLK